MEEKLRQDPSDCLKVVLFGPESTGKSTLAKQLADYYNTVFVPEYSRIHAEAQLLRNKTLTKQDVMPIAEGQMRLENEMTPKANKLLICDTDLLETKVYSEAYYNGYCDPVLEKYALENTYDLYFLTYIDIPWEADDLRDKPNEREMMFEAFESALKSYKKTYIMLKGSMEERFKIAIDHIDELLKLKS
ncbi:AAA family ATPase [Gelidibacter salicanalis]|uniref:ATP-binding protein n=1 Tax=Gelidibacter salicanalis TaxID=291193 RepID=A0A934KVB9_9FLAO|nr:ATP-binding protein [Gelidibacter salicanalis]MBJ7880060.1 ATP-binding protein [Gelidibacter salicanalis]